MFNRMQVSFVALSILLSLTACGGGDDGITSRTVVFAPSAAQAAPSTAVVAHPSPLRSTLSDEQRLAEETRMIAFEQSFSLEMQRQQLESQQRASEYQPQPGTDITAAQIGGESTVQ